MWRACGRSPQTYGRSREVLRLRFDEDLTQAEIAAILGVSQMQVSRILRQALQCLREISEHDARSPALALAGA